LCVIRHIKHLRAVKVAYSQYCDWLTRYHSGRHGIFNLRIR